MNSYVPALKRQHDDIQRTFESAMKAWSGREILECRIHLGNMIFLLKEHTHDESHFFFEKLRPNPRLNEGGPFCSYFFEFFMHNRPLVVASRLISNHRGEKVEIEIPKHIERFFSENSLLKIPLEEHLAIQALCRELLSVFNHYDAKNENWIEDVFSTLKDMVATNQKKEETCLWVAARQIMDPQGFNELCRTEVLESRKVI